MKKLLAVLLSLTMAFSLAAPALAVDFDFGEIQDAVGNVKDDACDAFDSAKDVFDNIKGEDALETVNSILALAEKLAKAIHTLVHTLADLFDFDCPFCVPAVEEEAVVVLPATPETLADVLASAKEGEVVSLAAGEYETITLGTLNGITIAAEDGAKVDKFVTTAETAVSNVTIKGFSLEIAGETRDCGLLIDAAAVIDNLVIEDTTFTGPATYKSCAGIFGNNPNATLTVKNCTFDGTGYAIWSVAKEGFAALTFDGCTFNNIYSWVILVQYGFLGDLTINGCTFTACEDGISKNGAFAADKTFTFTNNVVAADCAGHDGKDSKWFELKTANAVVTGNTLAEVEWIPGAAQGIKAL
ncbi:MAG: right-handed parallel beta-helix repeat-containing protein [Clostridia bacterium]|nr:right-handed parallel beta-helix repeat-containing protein [Clostridia bacterium]